MTEQRGTRVLESLGGQIFNGLVSGAFYAMLSLGLAIIFGLLRIVNFAHGTMYMLGAFVAYIGAQSLGLNFWVALVASPIVVAIVGIVLERTLLSRLYKLDVLYNLLLTFGITLFIEDAMRLKFGMQGSPYVIPNQLEGVLNLGFMIYPTYRVFVIVASLVVCIATWLLIEKTSLGATLRAATENPGLVRAFGINVPALITGVFGFGCALAAFAGVLAAPVNNVAPLMGDDIIIPTFAVVVIGGMGSILGSIVTGFLVGVVVALGAFFYPPISGTLIYILMAFVLLVKPTGLFGTLEGSR
ncbi:branched-chain amino acid ABC transporter permease [bacterium]|nr:MAG: branched-chain amino acid ABC transporter permease [bacterium]